MPGIACSVEDCQHVTPEGDIAAMTNLLIIHARLAHDVNMNLGNNNAGNPKAPPMTRPKIECEISEENWKVFTAKWDMFKNGANLTDRQIGPQLFDCCEESLKSMILKQNANFSTLDEQACLSCKA